MSGAVAKRGRFQRVFLSRRSLRSLVALLLLLVAQLVLSRFLAQGDLVEQVLAGRDLIALSQAAALLLVRLVLIVVMPPLLAYRWLVAWLRDSAEF